MPTPDGREWLSTQRIVEEYLWIGFYNAFREEPWFDHPTSSPDAAHLSSPFKNRVCAALLTGLRRTGYHQEFKLARLFEKFKDACARGLIEDVGQGTIRQLQAMFTVEVLDMMDEDGEMIE